jgi:hypothetical protein
VAQAQTASVKDPVRTALEILSITVIKTIRLMMYKAQAAV